MKKGYIASRIAVVLLFILPFLVIPSKADESGPDLTIAMGTTGNTVYDGSFRHIVGKYEAETGKDIEVERYDSKDLNTVMNIKILSGEGPDMFLAASIPYRSMAERKMFADIGALIEKDPDVDIEDFFPNIIKPLMDEEGHLYLMPCSFDFKAVLINKPLLNENSMEMPEGTLENLIKTCVEFTERTKNEPNAYALLWGTGEIADGAKKELITAMDYRKKISFFSEIDDTVYNLIGNPPYISSSKDVGKVPLLHDISPYLIISDSPSLDLPWNNAGVMNIFEYDEYEVRNFPRISNYKEEYFYMPTLAFCINKAGNVEEAWQFLKYLLSDEVQTGTLSMQYVIVNPVNIKAAEKRSELIREEVSKQAEYKRQVLPPISSLNYSTHTADEFEINIDRYLSIYAQMRDALRTPVLCEPILQESIYSAIEQEAGENFDPQEMKKELARIVDVYMGEGSGDIQSGYTIVYIIAGAVVVLSAVIIVAGRKKRGSKRPA